MEVFERYMGEEPSEEEQEYLTGAKERYKNKQPPGFNDLNKDSSYYKGRIRERKYGDLIVWKETLKYLENREEIEYVVFVSNDGKSNNKADIRHRVHDKNYDLHVSLISEMYYENKKMLYLMTNQEFIEYQIEMTEEEKNRIEEILTKGTINVAANQYNSIQQVLNNQLADNTINLSQTHSVRAGQVEDHSSSIGNTVINDHLYDSSDIGKIQRINNHLDKDDLSKNNNE